MKKINLIVVYLFLAHFLFAQNYKKLQEEAEKEFELSNFSNALELSRKALKEAEADKKISADDLLILKSDNAVYLVFNDKVDQGLDILYGISEIIDANKPKANTEIYLRKNFGAVIKDMGFYSDALPQFQKAYNLCNTNSYKKKDIAAITIGLAECKHYLYKFQEAETIYREAISFCEKENLTAEIEYPTVYCSLALLYVDMLFEKKALDTFEKANELFVKNQDTLDPQFSVFLMDYGTLLADIYRYEDALSVFMRAKNLDLKRYGENSAEYAGTLNNLGYTYARMNKFTETEQYYTKAIEIKRSLKRVRFDNYLTSVNNLLFFYTSVGREIETEELVAELEKGLDSPKLQDTLKRITFSENLAQYYAQRKVYIKAKKYYDDALNYSKRIYGDNNIEIGNIYISVSYMLWEQKKYEEAVSYISKISEVLSGNLKTNVDQTISLLINFSSALKAFGLPEQAEILLNEAIKLIESKVIISKSDIATIYLQKAEVSADLDKTKTAIEYFNKYLELKYGELDESFGYMTEAEKLQFLDNLESAVKAFYTTISNHADKNPELIQVLLNFRLQTKGILLNNLSKIKKTLAQLNDPVLNKKYEQLKLNRENISKLISLNTDDYPEAMSEVAILKKEADQAEKEISQKVLQSNFTGTKKITWKDIQKQLKPGECAIEILRANLVYKNDSGGTNYTYMIVKNAGEPTFYMIDRPLKWEEEVLELYRKSIDQKKNDPDLYRRLWKGVSEKAGAVTTIYISPDGIYNQVNLNTIFNPETNKYLIEEKNFHLLTTLRDLIEIKSHPSKAPKNAYLVGNPKFSYDLSQLPQNKQNFGNDLASRGGFGFVLDELPGTKTEVETIKTQLEKGAVKVTMLTEEKANEADVKKIKDPGVLHFATHGFFLEDFPEETLAELSKTEQAYFKNPMMRSGIFFSGANNTYSINTTNIKQLKEFEDGTLTAYEAMNLDLDKTELVILSACQTGLGKVKNGEGVFGLQRAFKLAGSKSIIMSLWAVSDDATMELMIALYSKWVVTGDLYNSFKEAQLEVKKKYPEPYYWGAFVLNGR
ncbi:MAG: CHAT domain-containing protein [Bacteroidetes bacterium]|nr:CHAT domain-containing protein [Bacteroidota bacterium]